MRATKGAVDTTRGGITPRTPDVVPTSADVTGMSEMSRMMKGSERPMFTTHPSTALSARIGRSEPGEVR